MTDASVGRFSVLICDDCQTLESGARTLCPMCRGSNLRPTLVPGRGVLLTWTVIRKPPLKFSDEESYALAVVELDAGVKIVTRLEADHEDVTPGTLVELVKNSNPEIITFGRIPS